MILFLRRFHHYWYQFFVAFFFAVLFPVFYYYSRKPERYPTLNKFRKLWSQLSFFFSGIFYEVIYTKGQEPFGTYIYCGNHASHIDTPFMCIIARGNYHFIGKHELLVHPVLKLFFKTIDIPVNRESKISGYRAFKKAAENIAAGMSLIIYPEGGIPASYPVMDEFKAGAFRLAIENKTPIVPITFLNNFTFFPDDGDEKGTTPGISRIIIDPPIPTAHLSVNDDEVLRDQVYRIIHNNLNSYLTKHQLVPNESR